MSERWPRRWAALLIATLAILTWLAIGVSVALLMGVLR